jgi:flavin-dependent dehydrogenase
MASEGNNPVHDVAIVGASISGATAAALLAGADRDATLLEAGELSELPRYITLLSPHSRRILDKAGVNSDSVLADPAHSCHFFHADFARQARPNLPAQKVHVVDRSAVIRELLRVASAHRGVSLHQRGQVVRLTAGEEFVTLALAGGGAVRARLVLLATGAKSELAEKAGLAVTRAGPGLWAACYACPAGSLSKKDEVAFVLGVGSGEGLGYRLAKNSDLALGVCVRESAHKAIGDLMHISKKLVEHGLVPGNWQQYAAGTRARWSPAGGALEMDTHVGKRILVIGEAGGFVAGYTNESAYPEMWSAELACQTVLEALKSRQPQDALREYDRTWRMTMAEYLRPPNTDAQSLLPLIFSNQQMADRMLESLLLGTNF